MTIFLFIALIVVLVPAFAALVHAVHGAADGYEDELQFHAGVCPQGAAVAAPAGARSTQNWVEGPRAQSRPRHAAKDTANA